MSTSPSPPYPTRYPTADRPARAAAATILLRRDPAGGEARVYMVRRSPKLRFLGGFCGYPGGRVDAADAELAGVDDRLDPAACAIAAVRELFEEAGVLLVPGADGLDGEALDRARDDLLTHRADFASVCGALGVAPRPLPGALAPAGRWETPYYSPLRFDTRYHVHLLAGEREPSVWPGELTEGWWSTASQVLDDWRANRVWLAPPVTETLRVIARGADPLDELLAGLTAVGRERGHPWHPVRMRHGVRLLSLPSRTLPPAHYTNSYLLGEEELLLVDPGAAPGAARARLERTVDRLRAEGRRLRAIWLTHHHLDHVDSAEAIRARTGAPIAAHPDTAAALSGSRRSAYRPDLPAIEVDERFDDGDRIALQGGFDVQVLHTPGHAAGHTSLWERAGDTLIAGDLVSGLSPVIISPPDGEMSAYLASLRRVIALGNAGLFPGHRPPAIDGRARIERLLEHRLWRQRRVLDAVRAADDGVRPSALVPHVYADVPAVAHPFAARTLEAHLQHLRDDGQVVFGADGRVRAAAARSSRPS